MDAEAKALTDLAAYDCPWCERPERTQPTDCPPCPRTRKLDGLRATYEWVVRRTILRLFGDSPASIDRYLADYTRAARAVVNRLDVERWRTDAIDDPEMRRLAEIAVGERAKLVQLRSARTAKRPEGEREEE